MLNSAATDPSASFCLCTMKTLLEEYALHTVERSPPRYWPSFTNDIGFYVKTSSVWKPVNNATWIELATMIKAPMGIYTRISLDGLNPVNDGLLLNGVRSAHLAEIIRSYREIINDIEQFHDHVIRSRTASCLLSNRADTTSSRSNRNNWQYFF
jgi:hypothetical protein